MACLRPCHSASERSRYFSVTISRMGPTSCAMPPCTSTRLSCSFRRVAAGTSSMPRRSWLGSRRPRLMPNSGSPSPARTPWISFDAGPDAAGILPAAAAAAEPFAEDGAGGHQAPVVFVERAGERVIWPVARMHTAIRQASRLVETARREPLGISFTLLTISMPWPGLPVSRASRSAERLGGAFHAGRHDAAGDDGGLEQARGSRGRNRRPRRWK